MSLSINEAVSVEFQRPLGVFAGRVLAVLHPACRKEEGFGGCSGDGDVLGGGAEEGGGGGGLVAEAE